MSYNISKKSRRTFYCFIIFVTILSLASIACDDGGQMEDNWNNTVKDINSVIDDVKEYDGQFGDAMGIGDKLEDVTGDVFD